MLENTKFPRVVRARQHFLPLRVENIRDTIWAELSALQLADTIKPGETVAVTAGSRGICRIAEIIRSVVDYLQSLGAKPFIVPAMGSHGGATAEGQCEVLHHYGITEETMGVPIRATMEVVKVDQLADGLPVYLDANAYGADHIAVVNRVKPHTDYHGGLESGLFKMMAIGLGKQVGATYYHRAYLHYGFEHVLKSVGNRVLETGKVAFGLAVVENGYDQTAKIVAARPENMEATERKLIQEARMLMARLPFEELDTLVVDEMGKNISGTGMDTNVIGRVFQDTQPEPESPKILRIFVRDMTEESGGNAAGIGFADMVTTRLIEKMDRVSTYMNALTAGTPQKMRTPLYYDTDRDALAWILHTIGLTAPENARLVWIRNTLMLDDLLISESLLPEAKQHPNLDILGEPFEMSFGGDGNLVSPFEGH